MIDRLARALSALSARIDRVCAVFAFVAMLIMLGALAVQIVARYIFDAPPVWTEELARYAMIWASMPGAAMAYYRRADPVLYRAPAKGHPRRAVAMQAIELLALLAFCIPVLWFAPGWLARHSHRITETLELNSAVVVAIIPLSLLFIVIHGVTRLFATLQSAQLELRSS
jgi:TRAP-type C4-dicarboxylate transport system permease small subunit